MGIKHESLSFESSEVAWLGSIWEGEGRVQLG